MTLDVVLIGLFFIAVQIFANIFVKGPRIRSFRWLSFSGGIAVSYIFVYVLPSLHEEQEAFSGELAMESELYILGLVGLMVFYTVFKTADAQQKKGRRDGQALFFYIQVGFFTLYNMMISYIVFASDVETIQGVFYAMAVGLHFMAVSHDLWREDKERYEKVARYILAAGILAGWLVGILVPYSSIGLAVVFAFISGAMLMNVLNKEMPNEENAHLPTFLISAGGYALIATLLKYFFQW
ncbi:hypothetical protein ATL39_1559 [Sinobaca qinghaiensis]|uniref:ZIP Zinc transporter n=1 Tax=Sinobaca qinghaiensis TaxID=342944 RepID=A0A419V419_9BACL|nr:hypothetical protein [Sinobaca qinghaiensis]RKD73268.1 hypothetical protein ATL39_1559 [Sinobaca qinghaiensis]